MSQEGGQVTIRDMFRQRTPIRVNQDVEPARDKPWSNDNDSIKPNMEEVDTSFQMINNPYKCAKQSIKKLLYRGYPTVKSVLTQ